MNNNMWNTEVFGIVNIIGNLNMQLYIGSVFNNFIWFKSNDILSVYLLSDGTSWMLHAKAKLVYTHYITIKYKMQIRI